MPQFHKLRLVPYAPAQMFDIVADVERYPEFVPHCAGMLVKNRAAEADGTTSLLATMTARYGPLEERFTSRVILNKPRNKIEASLISGPFHHLNNSWCFEPAGEGTTIVFDVDYEFRSKMLAFTMGAVFQRLFANFELAFEKRAGSLLGKNNIS